MITPTLITIQWKAYLVFMCTNFAFVPLVYFCYPETMNLTLEEIDYLYSTRGRSARQVSKELRKMHKEQGFNPEHGGSLSLSRTDTPPAEVLEHGNEKEKE